MTFSLMTLLVDGTPTPALCIGERHWALAEVAPETLQPQPDRGLMNVFGNWDRNEAVLVRTAQALADGSDNTPSLPAPAELEDVLTPLQYPRKMIFIGGNYRDHMHNEAGFTFWEKESNIPVFFFKPPTTTLVGPGKSVRYPIQTDQLDYEVELALIIGKKGRRLTLENAMDYVAGYSVAMDLSARDWQISPRHVVKFDLFAGKAFDDSAPLGPGIVPARFVNPESLQLKLWVNGVLRLDANTRDMMWSVAEQLVQITEHVTVEPGDVITLGCPARVGNDIGNWLIPGDVVDGEITGVGRLSVEIVKDH